MMLLDLFETIRPFLTMGVQALDLALVAIIVYWVYRLTKGTSAIPIFVGQTSELSLHH